MLIILPYNIRNILNVKCSASQFSIMVFISWFYNHLINYVSVILLWGTQYDILAIYMLACCRLQKYKKIDLIIRTSDSGFSPDGSHDCFYDDIYALHYYNKQRNNNYQRNSNE